MNYREEDREGDSSFSISATMQEAIPIPAKTLEENNDPY